MDKNLFELLLNSVNEMVAIENGEKEPNSESVHLYEIPKGAVLKLQNSQVIEE
ncbi:hypothetical protein AB7W40_19580 [Providencia rettgeri]